MPKNTKLTKNQTELKFGSLSNLVRFRSNLVYSVQPKNKQEPIEPTEYSPPVLKYTTSDFF